MRGPRAQKQVRNLVVERVRHTQPAFSRHCVRPRPAPRFVRRPRLHQHDQLARAEQLIHQNRVVDDLAGRPLRGAQRFTGRSRAQRRLEPFLPGRHGRFSRYGILFPGWGWTAAESPAPVRCNQDRPQVFAGPVVLPGRTGARHHPALIRYQKLHVVIVRAAHQSAQLALRETGETHALVIGVVLAALASRTVELSFEKLRNHGLPAVWLSGESGTGG